MDDPDWVKADLESHAAWIARLEHKVDELRGIVQHMPSAASIEALRREVVHVQTSYAHMEELVERQAVISSQAAETSKRLLEGWRAVGILLGQLK